MAKVVALLLLAAWAASMFALVVWFGWAALGWYAVIAVAGHAAGTALKAAFKR